MSRTIDYSALTSPTTGQAVRAFRTSMKAAGHNWGRLNVAGGVGVAVAVIAVIAVGGGTVGTWLLGVTASAGANQSQSRVLIPLLALGVVVLIAVVAVLRLRGNWERWMRLSRFAADNRMVFSPSDPAPGYPGLLFGIGSSREAINRLRSADGPQLDFGSYQYVTGTGKSRQVHNWGYLAMRLDRALPHMLLDSEANNTWFGTNLPTSFRKDQVLSLEGDFDRHFTLYCPREYERDALYVFTPDLMALLIDEASPFDIEIVDDWMFVYSSKPLAAVDPAIYQRLFRIVDTVGAKTLSQTDRYADERVESFDANIIAPPGRRLRGGFPVLAVVIVVVFVALIFGPQLLAVFN